jgi:hypothetical protein
MESSVKPPWWWYDVGGEAEEAFFNKREMHRQANLLRSSPRARGRSDESNGGPVSSDGLGDGSWATGLSDFPDLLCLPPGIVAASEGGKGQRPGRPGRPLHQAALENGSVYIEHHTGGE